MSIGKAFMLFFLFCVPLIMFAQDDDSENYFKSVDSIIAVASNVETELEVLLEYTENHPDNYVAFTRIGMIYNSKNEYAKAIPFYNAAIELNSKYLLPYLNRANSHLELGNVAFALENYDYFLSYLPTNSLAYYNRGRARKKVNQVDGAKSDFQKSIELNPESPLAYKAIAIVFIEAQDFDRAIESAMISVDKGLADFDNYEIIGAAYYGKKDFKKSIYYYDKALLINPSAHYVQFNRGLAYRKLGQVPRAIEAMSASIELSEDNKADKLSTRGLCYIDIGEFEKAKSDLEEALSIEEHAYYLSNLAYLNIKIGEYKLATKLLERSKVLDPKNPVLYKNYALLYKKKNRNKLARTNMDKALALGYKSETGEDLGSLKKYIYN